MSYLNIPKKFSDIERLSEDEFIEQRLSLKLVQGKRLVKRFRTHRGIILRHSLDDYDKSNLIVTHIDPVCRQKIIGGSPLYRQGTQCLVEECPGAPRKLMLKSSNTLLRPDSEILLFPSLISRLVPTKNY